MSEYCGSRLIVERDNLVIVMVSCELAASHDLMHEKDTIEGTVKWAATSIIRKPVAHGLDTVGPPLIDNTKRERQSVEIQDRAGRHKSPTITRKDGSR